MHKVRLKWTNSGFVKSWKGLNEKWLNKIDGALFYYVNEPALIDQREYIKVNPSTGSSVYLRPFTSDKDVYLQVFVNEDYKSVISIYEQIFKKQPIKIIDCGSNIGLTTVYFKEKYPKAEFLAIEPFADNISMMKLNFEVNNINKTGIIEGGVWNKTEKLFLNRDFRDGKEWSISVGTPNGSGGEIQAFSVLDIINQKGDIDILKIDIEGSEKQLFADIEYAKKFLQKVKCVAIEIHDEFDCRESIYQAFRQSNFFYFDISDTTIAINRSYM
jgi:FkbM family methyltransferase